MGLTSSVNFKTNVASSGSQRDSLAAEIAALRNDVRNMRIYLDTGVLVGAIDRGLGENYITVLNPQWAPSQGTC